MKELIAYWEVFIKEWNNKFGYNKVGNVRIYREPTLTDFMEWLSNQE